jgi:hypothetical protein
MHFFFECSCSVTQWFKVNLQWNVQGQSLSDAGGAKMSLLFAILHGHFHDCS